MRDEFYMQLALDKAWEYQGLTYPNPAVGAVVTMNGEILSIAAHEKAGTSHAEVLALIFAYETLLDTEVDFDPKDAKKAHLFLLSLPKYFFSQCSIYVTLEPCSHEGKTPSCSSLLHVLALQRVVIGINDPIEEHSGGMQKLNNVSIGIMEKECEALIEPFLIWQKRAFVLFKLAQTSNGRIGRDKDNTYLSSKSSLTHVHQLRAVCDTLFIGGNTVRTDRPTLDCRFVHAKAPDVKIYAKEDNFDKEIPLFGIKDRKVEIVQDLDFLKNPSFVLVEGGEGMLNVLREKIDWMLIYQTPKFSINNLAYNASMNLSFLHQAKKDVDLMIWSKHLDT
jgi:diaminohydroxyphosphoribosylaminopyrimidine deaminase/5-amino-6-(5-phosphoribosylamino)uracil reductase